MISDDRSSILDALDAMRAREETIRYSNSFDEDDDCGEVTEASRAAVATWLSQVRQTFSLGHETVWIGMSYLDRYVASSGRGGDARRVLGSKCLYQLAAIASFYTAVKIYEPRVIGLDILVRICRDAYAEEDFRDMEREVLSALDWRVACHTPVDVAEHLLELLPDHVIPPRDREALLDETRRNVDRAVLDAHFSSRRPSVVGVACLANAMSNGGVLSPAEGRRAWLRLSRWCRFDLSSKEIAEAGLRLLFLSSEEEEEEEEEDATPSSKSKSKFGRGPSSSSSRPSSSGGKDVVPGARGGGSKWRGPKAKSPVCVTRAARQA